MSERQWVAKHGHVKRFPLAQEKKKKKNEFQSLFDLVDLIQIYKFLDVMTEWPCFFSFSLFISKRPVQMDFINVHRSVSKRVGSPLSSMSRQ